jgi:transposase InsO family protein
LRFALIMAIKDLHARKIVGWAMVPDMPAQLVCSALQMAITTRCPAPGLIVHAVWGSQYASDAHHALLARHKLIASMSRKGNCWDNAVMERFFLNLKMERVWQREYANHSEAMSTLPTTSLASTTPCVCIPNWAICRPMSTNNK